MNYYPVLIPTLNRHEHLKDCIESLLRCTHADQTELVIGLDYPPSDKYIEGWKAVEKYIDTITGFKKITIFKHKENLGPTNNTKFLREYAFSKYDAYIFSEDDNTFAPCFLDFMNKCLEKYKYNEKIYYVCGCLEPDINQLLFEEIQKIDSSIIKVIGNISAYGIGMWKDKERQLQNYFPKDFRKYIFSSRKRIITLLKAPAKLNHVYYWIKNKPELNCLCDFTRNTWAVLHNQQNILPIISLVKNNGFDGSGVNCDYSAKDLRCWENTNICKNDKYDIIDKINDDEINNWSKKLFNCVSKDEKKQNRYIIFMNIIFGYQLTEIIEKLQIKKMIKKILNIH